MMAAAQAVLPPLKPVERLFFNGEPLPTLREVVDHFGIHGVHSAFAGHAMGWEQFLDFEKEYHVVIKQKIQERLDRPFNNWLPMRDICRREAQVLVGFDGVGCYPNPQLGGLGLEPPPKRLRRLRPQSFAAYTSSMRRVRFDCMLSIVDIPNRFEAGVL